MSDNAPTADELTAAMDAQVAANRETSARVGGNTVEPGVYELPAEPAPAPVVDEVTNESNAANVAAMDAQVAAANGSGVVAVTDGVETSAPAETKAPARAKTK